MSNPSDEWSDDVDIVRRALTVLELEMLAWVQSTATWVGDQYPAVAPSVASEDDR